NVAAYAHRNGGSLFATLTPLSQRSTSADAVAAHLRRELTRVPGATFGIKSEQLVHVGGSRSRSADQYTIEADSVATLRQWTPQVKRTLSRLPQLRNVHLDSDGTGLQTVLHVNRSMAARRGVNF